MQGLTENEAKLLLAQYGKNILRVNETKRLFRILGDVIKEPMFLLLMAACIFYFLLGENTEGLMMIVALMFVAAISVYQEIRSTNALASLQQLTEPKVKVIRAGIEKEIEIEDLVPGDLIVLEEGTKVPADAQVLQANDLSLNESIITGESLPVEKNKEQGNNLVYQGTVVNSGRCVAKVFATGADTVLGKIGKSIITYSETKTHLQHQIDFFVKRLALFGIIAFFVIFLVNYLHNQNVIASLLLGLTLAMSAIPEEIPVAFSSFMALGAYYMSRIGIITRQPQTIENLGAVNVICLDKTGTITENKMKVDTVYDYASDAPVLAFEKKSGDVLYFGLLACEQSPFDAMEQAIIEAYKKLHPALTAATMIHEYPLQGRPPMMTHVYSINGETIVAAKGGVERIIQVCKLSTDEATNVMHHAKAMASKGHRVLGVAGAMHRQKEFPVHQDDFNWQFKGLVSLYDPPKAFVKDVFKKFYDAGIAVKLLTGDFPETAVSIAKETGLKTTEEFVTGEVVMKASDEELSRMTNDVTVFARMHPEAKLKVINIAIQILKPMQFFYTGIFF